MNPLGLEFGDDEEIDEDKYENEGDRKRRYTKDLGLHESQHKRLKGLQNPNAIFDNAGNLLESHYDHEERLKQEKTSYFIFKCCRMPLKRYIRILMCILVIAMFFERFFFAVIVYKTKNYGYSLILLVLFFNAIFLYLMIFLRKKKEKKRLLETYATFHETKISWVIIAVVG